MVFANIEKRESIFSISLLDTRLCGYGEFLKNNLLWGLAGKHILFLVEIRFLH